jgi:squalene-hopene/tetraprenyl-beta-curcumene cyclase
LSNQNTGLLSVVESTDDLRFRVRQGLENSQSYLLSIQGDDGHWCGELEGDTILESEYILTMHYVGRANEPKLRKAANYVRDKQHTDGGWSIYPGGPPDVSSSVKAYFALKLLGDSPDAPHMVRARRVIRSLGGLDACNSFTKIYLSVFGQYDWNKCPSVPPELMLFPRWFYINIYEMSSWSRAILVPLSIISACRPHCPVPPSAGIRELQVDGYRPSRRSLWSSLFHGLDAGIKLVEKLPIRVTRELALKRSERWILERLRDSDGLGAIFPPIINTIIALHTLDYSFEHPTVAQQIRELERLEIEDGDTVRIQPCFSPVWDTALAVNALSEAGLSRSHPALLRAAEWLIDKRGNGSGDWKYKNRDVEMSGWFFEYANPFYPDCDTTSQVITALSKLDGSASDLGARCQRAIFESHHWHLTMQNRDGGWGAFDRDCDKEILTQVPFADHNAMVDPSTSDLTARGLETLAVLGFDRGYPPAKRAIEFLHREQEADGSWFGRWGCNYLYGTWLALWGLKCIGEDMNAPWAKLSAGWLKTRQNGDGGWGELPLSYDDPEHKGRGPSTASQTAWALLGLLATGEVDSPEVVRGVEFLLREQSADGSWTEEHWTGTGFPSVFYLRYHLYPVYFPLLALATYEKEKAKTGRGVRNEQNLRIASSTPRVAAP